MRPLPPLNSLRAFEAAASHLSFTQAAEELNVTQAAVSHQIKTLEEALGTALFSRLNRQLELTNEGRAFLPAVRDALAGLAEATRRIREDQNRHTVAVSTMDSFAIDWLVPRLKHFNDDHPNTDVWITTWNSVVRFPRDNVDIEIRYGDGKWPDCEVTALMQEEIFPVCSPEFVDEHGLREPKDLVKVTLLHDRLMIDWDDWLRAADVEGIDTSQGLHFNHSHLLIRAAIKGEGIGLGRSVLVADAIADGLLVKPFDIELPDQYAYYVVCRPGHGESPDIKVFKDWLLREAGGEDKQNEKT